MRLFRRNVLPSRGLLADTPGPSPWYLRGADRTLPSRRGPLAWQPAREAGFRTGKTLLVAPSGEVLLILNFHCYVRPLVPPRFLVWHPEGEGAIRIDAFGLDESGRQVSQWLSTNPFT